MTKGGTDFVRAVNGSIGTFACSTRRQSARRPGERMPASRLLRQPEIRLEQLLADRCLPGFELDSLAPAIDITSAETTVKYAGYLLRQESEVQRGRKDERRRIPAEFPFDRVPGLSREVVQRLSQIHPDTLGHALRVPGVTPAAVAVLSAYIGRLSPMIQTP